MTKHKPEVDPFLHQLLSLPKVFNAQISPDGKWVAFDWYRIHENMDVFVVPTDGSAAASPICGMTNLMMDYETTRPDLRPFSEEMMGGSLEQVPERYRERSPIHFPKHLGQAADRPGRSGPHRDAGERAPGRPTIGCQPHPLRPDGLRGRGARHQQTRQPRAAVHPPGRVL